ncbi:MAG: LysR family transcriptional regulator [Clostridiales bacterium]|nr:LysR family transcriptional regulator [Clostridiales bacterium]
MTTFQIQCFLSAAETLNFTEAANRMFIAQSSLSRNISRLETEIGLTLFIRTKKYVRLTPAGTVLYAEYSKLLKMADYALEKARNAEIGENGNLRLGVLETQRSENFLPAQLNRLRQSHPHIQIDIISGTFRELREGIMNNTIDIALTLSFDLEDFNPEEIVYQTFFRSQPKCVISKSSPWRRCPILTGVFYPLRQ